MNSSLTSKLTDTVEATCKGTEIKPTIRLEEVQYPGPATQANPTLLSSLCVSISGLSNMPWLSSDGTEYMKVEGSEEHYGPPWGYNLILETEAPQQWPAVEPSAHAATTSDDKLECRACGAKVVTPDMQFCPSCGAKQDESSNM